MNEQHIVSIIVPIYNAEKTLQTCLSSIVGQTYRHLEIILVNDGSTDQSLHICKTFARKDSRIKIVNQQNNGPSSARNAGIKEATGTFIQFIDADDCITNTMTEQLMVDANEMIDLVICGYTVKKDKYSKEIVPQMKGLFTINHFSQYVGQLYAGHLLPSPCNKLYRANIIKQNDITFPLNINLGEDLLFNMSYLRWCETVYVNDTPLYIYHNNDQSLSNQLHVHYFNHQLMLIDTVKDFVYLHDAYSSLNIYTLNTVLAQTVINTFTQLFQHYDDKGTIKREIEKLTSNHILRDQLRHINGSYQANVIKFLISFKLNTMLYSFFNVKNMLRSRISKLYHLFKKINDKSKRYM